MDMNMNPDDFMLLTSKTTVVTGGIEIFGEDIEFFKTDISIIEDGFMDLPEIVTYNSEEANAIICKNMGEF